MEIYKYVMHLFFEIKISFKWKIISSYLIQPSYNINYFIIIFMFWLYKLHKHLLSFRSIKYEIKYVYKETNEYEQF